MGWADCGKDSKGRSIGYAHDATCDHEGCEEPINRGLGCACGGMHGDCGGQACDGYFCEKHLHFVDSEAMGFDELRDGMLCGGCVQMARVEIADLVISGDLKVVSND